MPASEQTVDHRLLEALSRELSEADAVVVGAGAGLSTAAGLEYSGARFEQHFADFAARYGLRDMYSAGFFPFPTPEEKWAYWSRYVYINRYDQPERPTMTRLREILEGRGHQARQAQREDHRQGQDYFVITTNVDHSFQLAGFDKERLFYTQGDYGLWQCSVPCAQVTYDNEDAIRAMVAQQEGMRVPTDLLPSCPRCGEPMAMNLRSDETFVQDDGWHAAARRYLGFLEEHDDARVLFLEIGVGGNTPGIIKYPFWQMTHSNPQAVYACLNLEPRAPQEIAQRSILVQGDIAQTLKALHSILHPAG